MDPRDFFRGFFGISPPHLGRRPPEEEEPPDLRRRDGGEDGLQGRGGGGRFHAEVFTNPLEMERFFDQQLDQMLRGFGFGLGGLLPPPEDDGRGGPQGPAWSFPFDGWGMMPALPPPGYPSEEKGEPSAGSRDFMLKGGFGYDKEEGGGRREDSDLDGEDLAPGRIGEIFKEPPSQRPAPGAPWHAQPPSPFPSPFFGVPGSFSRSFGSSTSTTVVTRPDGSTERRTVKRSSDGAEETTVTVTGPGGASGSTVVTRRAPGGAEEETLSTPEGPGWAAPARPGDRDDLMSRERDTTRSLFGKFFGR